MQLQKQIHASLVPGMFASSSEEEMARYLEKETGEVTLMYGDDRIIGCSVAFFPKPNDPENLGKKLGYSTNLCQNIAHFESIFVLSEFQGQGIAYQLSQQAIQKAQARKKDIILATVHPCNIKSLKNLFSLHLMGVKFAYLYGDLPRFILQYSTQFEMYQQRSPVASLHIEDFAGHKEQLQQNNVAVQISAKEQSYYIQYVAKNLSEEREQGEAP